MTKRNSFKIFLAVQNALFLRELAMRFSSGRMGFFWTFVEPFFQIMVFVFIKLTLFDSGANDFDFAVFLALNFTAFNMFKHIVMKSSTAFKANKALFVYKQVKPIDTIIARMMVEVFITAVIIIVFLCLGFYFGFDMEIKDLTMVTLGFFALLIFSFSVSLVIAVANTFVDSIGKLIGFLLTGLMFGSAVFYNVAVLPLELQTLILYNPLAHFLEIIHGFYFHTLDDSMVSYSYILLWTLSLLYIGLWFYVKLEKRILSV